MQQILTEVCRHAVEYLLLSTKHNLFNFFLFIKYSYCTNTMRYNLIVNFQFGVHGSVHHNINLIEITNKMRLCIGIYYSNVS